jgi:hypothetical protein
MTAKKPFISPCSVAVLIGALSVAGTANARGDGHNVEVPEFGTSVFERKYSRGYFRGQGASELQDRLNHRTTTVHRGRGAVAQAGTAERGDESFDG